MKKSVFVATPMYGGQCAGFYTQSLLMLQKLLNDHDVDSYFTFVFNESLVTRGRNSLVNYFMQTDCTHLLFVDADIKFDPQQFLPMLNAEKDIICGIYPKKEINWRAVKFAADYGVPHTQLKNHTGSLAVNFVDFQPDVSFPVNEPVEVWAAGTGFMLIARQVFEKLADKVPQYRKDSNLGTQSDMVKEYFTTYIDPKTNALYGEDYYFCNLARENGIKIHAAPWVQLGHIGSYLFEGGLTYK